MNEMSRSVIPLLLSHLLKNREEDFCDGTFLMSVFPGRKPIIPISLLTILLPKSRRQFGQGRVAAGFGFLQLQLSVANRAL